MKLLGIKPFDAFIASEFHGNASGLRHRSVYVDVDVAVDSFSCKVELFISLDEEVSHKLQLDLDLIARTRVNIISVIYSESQNLSVPRPPRCISNRLFHDLLLFCRIHTSFDLLVQERRSPRRSHSQ